MSVRVFHHEEPRGRTFREFAIVQQLASRRVSLDLARDFHKRSVWKALPVGIDEAHRYRQPHLPRFCDIASTRDPLLYGRFSKPSFGGRRVRTSTWNAGFAGCSATQKNWTYQNSQFGTTLL
jgi:hypothetical protein